MYDFANTIALSLCSLIDMITTAEFLVYVPLITFYRSKIYLLHCSQAMLSITGICVLCCLAGLVCGQVPFVNIRDLMVDDELIPTCESIHTGSAAK